MSVKREFVVPYAVPDADSSGSLFSANVRVSQNLELQIAAKSQFQLLASMGDLAELARACQCKCGSTNVVFMRRDVADENGNDPEIMYSMICRSCDAILQVHVDGDRIYVNHVEGELDHKKRPLLVGWRGGNPPQNQRQDAPRNTPDTPTQNTSNNGRRTNVPGQTSGNTQPYGNNGQRRTTGNQGHVPDTSNNAPSNSTPSNGQRRVPSQSSQPASAPQYRQPEPQQEPQYDQGYRQEEEAGEVPF